MQTWLKAKDLYFEEIWTKPQLYETIKNNKGEPAYKIEHVLKHESHELVRLPPYHCDLNPIEKGWSHCKTQSSVYGSKCKWNRKVEVVVESSRKEIFEFEGKVVVGSEEESVCFTCIF